MVFNSRLLGAMCASITFISLSANAAIINLQPIEDAYTSSWEPDTNFNDQTLITSEDYPYFIHVSYLKFDLSAIPTNEVIVAATLNLFQIESLGPGVAFGNSLFHFTDNWSETTITSNNAANDVISALGGPVLSNNTEFGTPKYTQYDLFQFLAWDPSPDRADGLLSLLLVDTIGGDSAYGFCSKDSDPLLNPCLAQDETVQTQDRDPFLTIQTSVIPVPPAVWLFGSGLLGLIGVARRKKS